MSVGHLVVPLTSVLIIFAVALLATIAAGKKPGDEPSNVSPQDVSSFVGNAVENIALPTPSVEPVPAVRPTYQVVIEQPQMSPPPQSPPESQLRRKDDNKELMEQITLRTNRSIVGLKAWSACEDKQKALSMGLFGLDVSGKKIQDNYAYDRDGNKLIADFEEWNQKAKDFFVQYKYDLPNFDVIDLANQDAETKTFLGIGGDVSRTFGRLNAKRKVIQSISGTITRRDCELVRKAAIADCIEKDKC